MSERGFRFPEPGGERDADLAGAPGARVLDFRRRRAPTKRKKRSFWLSLVKPLVLAALVVAMPLSLGAWTFTSDRFALTEIFLDGRLDRVSHAWVTAALAPLRGQNLVRISLADAARRLSQNRWIASAEIVKELPHRLRLHLVERRPAILLRSSSGLFYADAAGQAIAPIRSPAEAETARRQGLLTVAFVNPVPSPEASVAAALALAAEIRRAEPAWVERLTQIDILGAEDFRLETSSLPCPVLVARGRIADKLARLERLLPQISERYPAGLAAIDLRFAERIVLKPNVSRNRTEGGRPPGVLS